ncbi:hypothetical protein C8Q75DRAFT_740346 [Abortiporus biennis]|nr:hypothetical protein C8Q75DRAFT_740346 [Abortiporus biennis]
MDVHEVRELCYRWRVIAAECLDLTKKIDDQDMAKWKTFVEKAKQRTPMLSLYEASWPVESYMRMYLCQPGPRQQIQNRRSRKFRPVRHDTVYVRSLLLAAVKKDAVVARISQRKTSVAGHCFIGRLPPSCSNSQTPEPSPPLLYIARRSPSPLVFPPPPSRPLRSPSPLLSPSVFRPIPSRTPSPALRQRTAGPSISRLTLTRGQISVDSFLESLETPQPQLLPILESIGVKTSEDLIGFALLPSHDIWLRDLVKQKAINLLQWMSLCTGLQALLQSLPDQTRSRDIEIDSVESFLTSLRPTLSKLMPVFNDMGVTDLPSLQALAIATDRDCYLDDFMRAESSVPISQLELKVLSEGLDAVGRESVLSE